MPVIIPNRSCRLYKMKASGAHTWDTYYAHALGSGAAVVASAVNDPATIHTFSNVNYAASMNVSEVSRFGVIFNTSGISERPEFGYFKLFGNVSSNGNELDIVCVKANFASNNSFTGGDFDAWDEASPTIYTSTILASSYDIDGYNNFVLSPYALDDMRDLSYLKMMCMSEIDATYIGDGGDTDDDPPDDTDLSTGFIGSLTDVNRRPYIIYDGYSHKVAGVDGADISEVNGIPAESILDVDGIGNI